MEKLTLTTPEIVPSNTDYHISRISLDYDGAAIDIYLTGANGNPLHVVYYGPTAITLLTAFNKLNLSTRSLRQRIFDKLVTDGHLAGSVTGTVD